MDENLYANIIEIMFLFFLESETDKRLSFTLDEVKEIFQSRYNWTWDSDLQQGLHLLIKRFSNGQSGLLMLSETNEYLWQSSSVFEETTDYFKSVSFTSLSLKNNLILVSKLKNLNVNLKQIYEDSVWIVEHLLREKEALKSNSENELPF